MSKLKQCLSFFVCFFLLAIAADGTMAFATSIEAEKNQLKAIEEKKKEEEKNLEELNVEKGKIEAEIKDLDKEAEEIVDKLQVLGKKINHNKERIAKLDKEIIRADSDKNKHYQTMKKRVKYIYENGDPGYLDIFSGSMEIEDILNKAEYVSKISEYDNHVFERYLLAKEDAEEKRSKQEIELKSLETNKALVDNELLKNKAVSEEKNLRFQKYQGFIKKSGAIISQISGEIEEKEAHIETLIAIEEKKRKEEEERERRRQLALQNSGGNTNVNVSKKGFLWPLPGYGTISSGFGRRGVIIKGGGSFHSGIDIPAPIGTSIVAALDGTVSAAGYHYSMGNYVLLSHGGGLYTVYMHASKLLVSPGAFVSKGQKISLVGSTGFSTGPHLHFGVKVNGAFQNPSNYVSP